MASEQKTHRKLQHKRHEAQIKAQARTSAAIEYLQDDVGQIKGWKDEQIAASARLEGKFDAMIETVNGDLGRKRRRRGANGENGDQAGWVVRLVKYFFRVP